MHLFVYTLYTSSITVVEEIHSVCTINSVETSSSSTSLLLRANSNVCLSDSVVVSNFHCSESVYFSYGQHLLNGVNKMTI